jgi:signal peptidase II
MSTPSSHDLAANPSPDAPSEAPLPGAPVDPGLAPGAGPSYPFLIGVALVNLVADLATKHWAEKTLQTPSQIPLPKSLFKGLYGGFGFMLARNKGGAWGLLHSYEEKFRKPFFVTVSVLAILFIVSLYRKLHPSQTALRWGLPLVLGGALGNLVDRIRYGHVIDFIDFYAVWGGGPHHWPTFNVADISICVGVGLMAVDMLTARRTTPAELPPSAPSEPAVASAEGPSAPPGA